MSPDPATFPPALPSDSPGAAPIYPGFGAPPEYKRGREVLALLLEGKTYKQIGKTLGISHHTVSNHVNVMYKHYGVHRRADLIALSTRVHALPAAGPVRMVLRRGHTLDILSPAGTVLLRCVLGDDEDSVLVTDVKPSRHGAGNRAASSGAKTTVRA